MAYDVDEMREALEKEVPAVAAFVIKAGSTDDLLFRQLENVPHERHRRDLIRAAVIQRVIPALERSAYESELLRKYNLWEAERRLLRTFRTQRELFDYMSHRPRATHAALAKSYIEQRFAYITREGRAEKEEQLLYDYNEWEARGARIGRGRSRSPVRGLSLIFVL